MVFSGLWTSVRNPEPPELPWTNWIAGGWKLYFLHRENGVNGKPPNNPVQTPDVGSVSGQWSPGPLPSFERQDGPHNSSPDQHQEAAGVAGLQLVVQALQGDEELHTSYCLFPNLSERRGFEDEKR